jgi:chitinase
VTDPVVTDPVVTDPVVTDPVVTDPVVTDPVVTDPVVTDPVVTDPSASPIANYDKVLAAYFPEWGIYGRDYQLADVPADELTHLIYAFADLNAAGEMTLFDSYAATEKRFSAEESVTGEADQWYYPPEDPRSEQTIWGNFNQLALLKEANPHLTLSIAVGGWTLSDHFSTVTSTQAGRDTFSDSIVEFLTTYQVFDGIDFDWEYPGGGGEAGNSASPNDGANYALLMADVRAKLDDLGSELGRTYEISIASPGGLDKIANFNLAGLAPSVDFFNVMTYDFHGTWEDTTGHQAAFTGDPVGYDIETSVDAYLNAGVAPEQIVLGAPLYTRAWSGVADGGDGGYNEASSGAAPGTYEAGNYDYKDLLSQINAGAGWELYWDDNAQASYVYNAEQDIFSSFETTTSIALKAEWADAMGLGGMMFWDLSNDATNSPDSLISAAFRSMVLEEDLAEIEADSALPDPIVVGGDGVIGPLPL